jgi:hypothetical protein
MSSLQNTNSTASMVHSVPSDTDEYFRCVYKNYVHNLLLLPFQTERLRLKSPKFAVPDGTLLLAWHVLDPLGMSICLILCARGSDSKRIHQFAALCSGTSKMQLTLNLSMSCMTSGISLTGGKISGEVALVEKKRQVEQKSLARLASRRVEQAHKPRRDVPHIRGEQVDGNSDAKLRADILKGLWADSPVRSVGLSTHKILFYEQVSGFPNG